MTNTKGKVGTLSTFGVRRSITSLVIRSPEVEWGTSSPLAKSALAIVVVNFRSHELIDTNLGAAQLLTERFKVFIVDNFSTVHELNAVTDVCRRHGWQLVALSHNSGFGTAVNAGIAKAALAGCGCYLVLNPDVVVSRAVIEELHENSVREPMSLITPRLVDSNGGNFFRGSLMELTTGRLVSMCAGAPPTDGGVVHHRGGIAGSAAAGRRHHVVPPTSEWLTAACLMINERLLLEIGGFSDDYFLYWEDVELSYRATLAGATLVVRHDLLAVHDEGGTQGSRRTGAKSNIYYRYNCRNRLVFAAQHLSRRQVVCWIIATPRASWEILLRGGRRQLLHSPRPLISAVVGSLSGLRVASRALVVGSKAAGLSSSAALTSNLIENRMTPRSFGPGPSTPGGPE